MVSSDPWGLDIQPGLDLPEELFQPWQHRASSRRSRAQGESAWRSVPERVPRPTSAPAASLYSPRLQRWQARDGWAASTRVPVQASRVVDCTYTVERVEDPPQTFSRAPTGREASKQLPWGRGVHPHDASHFMRWSPVIEADEGGPGPGHYGYGEVACNFEASGRPSGSAFSSCITGRNLEDHWPKDRGPRRAGSRPQSAGRQRRQPFSSGPRSRFR
eukprot:TRINITY_DN32907_c0_g1_i1.p1 TRINITY_DN32907_c0_g1~~TRINITY_DN32907_c0_g1_i1.p1  ORF type:complete len:233 (+),score=15.08 TRINITY_DN32907_c0_g1_i1:50-700(+)